MSELESIEKLVREYTPRIEEIFGKEMGKVKVQKCPISHKIILKYVRRIEIPTLYIETKGRTIYVDLKKLKKERQAYPGLEKGGVAHELVHILDDSNNLSPNIQNPEIQKYISEGFATYVQLEFSEIYQNQKIVGLIKEYFRIYKQQIGFFAEPGKGKEPYIVGYNFFKAVGDKIGRENILKVFQNHPQTMKEILQPQKYLERIRGGKWKV